jgi:hypothetical protein
MGKIKNRTVTKARFLYLFVIFGGISMFVYGIASLFTPLPFWPTLTPVAMVVLYLLCIFTVKNIRSFWTYIIDTEQGRLRITLTNMTHFGEQNKDRLVQWVYPRSSQVRNETWLKLGEKVRTGQQLTKEEKKQASKKVVTCPQQVQDGINKAILVNALIWAHLNIHVLDNEIREILELTDANMLNFNIDTEIDRCRKEEYRKSYDRAAKVVETFKEEDKK